MKYETKILKQIYNRITKSMSGLNDINIKVGQLLSPCFIPSDKCINMPSVISWAKNDEQDFQFGRGTLVHEAGHVLFAPSLSTEVKMMHETFKNWINVFLDCNNENKVVEIFPHLRVPLAQKTEGVYESNPEMLKTDNPFMQVLMRCYEVSDKMKAEYPDGYNEKLRKFVDWTVKKYYDDKIGLATGHEVIIFTRNVDKRFRKLMDEDEDLAEAIKKLMKEKGEAIMDGADESKLKDIDEKIGIARSGGRPTFDDGVDARILGEIPTVRGVYSEDSLKVLKDKIKKKERDIKGSVFIGKVDVQQLRNFELNSKSNDVDLAKAKNIGKRIKKRLMNKINLASTYGDRHRSGLIDIDEIRRQISDYGMLIKESLFKRDEIITRGGEWAVEVLCDLSGSMQGTRMKHAKQALATLAYGFDGLPNIHYSLIGFSDVDIKGDDEHWDKLKVTDFIIKGMNKKLDIKKITGLRCQQGNTDGFNIRSSARRLCKMNCKKIMIVISDGSPVYEGGHQVDSKLSPMKDTLRAIYEARANNINVIGIAIDGAHEESHIRLYGTDDRYDFRDNTENLDKELAEVILKAIGNKLTKKFVKRKWRTVE